jgi:LuxR family maltose regulon positive regulatory protein
MPTPLLATKLYIPLPRSKAVFRPRLLVRLNEGLLHNRKLTLIAAPAGFGKTTLLSEWVAACDRKAAWLSLDEADSDATRFLTYFVAALHKIAPVIGEGVLGMLQAPQPPPPETILTALLNEIATIADKFLLILDDYHLLEDRAVDEALIFLVEHLPPQMHLVIATREDPPLPLARLRVRNQLTELRATDLRFTPDEAAEFLKEVMGLDLSGEEVAALEARTEGWVAWLQLAALSMRGHQDVGGFIRAFAGDHRYIVDYLVEEVLQRQSESVRHFLLQTAILDRLTGSLCEAVTGQQGGSGRLEALERGNFFVVGLDDTRHWYRYHHLFGEVLYAHLQAEEPAEQVTTLHRRASEWYEHNGSAAEAIRHALAAGDFERAADLIELGLPAMRRNRQASILLGWLKALPDELLEYRPVLSVGYAWGLMDSGELEAVEARLREAERWLNPTTVDRGKQSETPSTEANSKQSRGMVVVNQEEFHNVPAAIAGYRAARAHVLGDVPGTLKYARQVLDLLPEEDNMWRGAATSLLGLAYWTSGELEAAYRTYGEGWVRMQKAGFISDAISGTIMLADIRIEQGHLHEAMSLYERALQLANAQDSKGTRPVLQGTADLYVGMGELRREHNELTVATQHLLKSKELGEHTGFMPNRYRWCVAMARIREAQGDPDGALEMFHEAERAYVRDFFPNVRPIAALRARVWAGQGRLSEALGWVRAQGLSVEDDLSYLREFEHITLARILLAQFRNRSAREDRSIGEAVGFLERLLKAARAGERRGSEIEILVLQSLAHQAQGDIQAALVPLEQALTLAEPEGYVRLFVDEGQPIAQLLRGAVVRGVMPAFSGKLLAVLGAEQPTEGEPSLPVSTPTFPPSQTLIEPLSQRELEVLRLFKTELSGPEIAQKLVIALSTLRTHTKSIYSKLNVDNRRAAVKRATELDLL